MLAAKGHGTENDFVVVPDLDGTAALTPSLVAAICDRHAGVGADGVLRVVRCAADPAAASMAADAEWFMDYRNADGSVAEMCGNGIRVFARWLVDAGLAAPGDLPIATRAGVLSVRLGAVGDVSVDMGPWAMPTDLGDLKVAVTDGPAAGREVAAVGVLMPNPHASPSWWTSATPAGCSRPRLSPPRTRSPPG